jgi:glutathionylspermidine synthase
MAVDRVVQERLYDRLGIDRAAHDLISESWRRFDKNLIGRFDLSWDGTGEPKLLEYNADTPAGLVEAAVTQWSWLEALHPDRDQWNLLHDLLVQAWQRHTPPGAVVHLAADEGEPVEDWNTVAYLADTVAAAGRHPVQLSVRAIAFSPATRAFVDATDERDPRFIETIFKMYPWEWMLGEPLGRQVVAGGSPTRWLEPVHKVLTGSKALLPALWELYPDHPNLLPASWDPHGMRDHVAKPVFGWEGAGIRITRGGAVTAAPPRHTAGQAEVYQQHVELPSYDGNLPVLGTWVVDGEPAGLGIRESTGPVTDAQARFLPHRLDAPRSTDEQVRQWLDPRPPTGEA